MQDNPKKPKAAPTRPKSEFGTPEKVINVVKRLQDIEVVRASDRAAIESLFNGQRPYSDEEVTKFNIQINVNWQEGKRIMRDANSQLNSALIHPGNLFQCSLRDGPVDKRDEWGQIFTTEIHRPLQEGVSGFRNFYLIKDRNASVCMHGIGALLWASPYKWMPRYVPLEDLLIPTETKCDFSNLRYFAVNLYLTIGELIDMTQGDVLGGWNQKMIKQILESQQGLYNESTPSTWRWQPEAMASVFYQNRGYYYSDAIPKVRCVQFFWQEMDKPHKWYRVVYLRENPGGKVEDIDKKFLFDGTAKPFADDISQILNVQYGDNNFVAPCKYHNVRGLGVDLYAPVETLNRLRCEFVQSVFEHLKMYFHIKDPADRDRLKAQIFQQYGFIQDGLQIVRRDERHQIDPNLVGDAIGQMSEIMSQSSSSYVADQDSGGEKTMTAKEAQIKLNQSTAMVSSMIATMYVQEEFYYGELKRRFCEAGSTDAEVQAFQSRCIARGIPKEFINKPEVWKVIAERQLGGGDATQAQAQVGWLMQFISMFGPDQQQIIKRMAVSTVLNDPAKANLLVPPAPTLTSAGSMMAEQLFGTMMQGVQVAPRQGIDIQGYVAQLLKMMGEVIQRITQTNNTGTMEEVIGLGIIGQNVDQNIKILAADPKQKQNVKEFGDALGKMMNLVKGFGQRLQEAAKMNQHPKILESISYKDVPDDVKRQMEQAAGLAPSQMPVSDPKLIKAHQQLQITDAKFQQKQRHTEIAFQMEQLRKNTEAAANLSRAEREHRQQLAHAAVEKLTQLLMQPDDGGEQEGAQSGGKQMTTLDPTNAAHVVLARHFMKEAGNDKAKALQLANQHGFQ